LFHGPADQFVDFIRANIPSDARVRIVQPARTSGSSGPGATGECGQNVASANLLLLIPVCAGAALRDPGLAPSDASDGS